MTSDASAPLVGAWIYHFLISASFFFTMDAPRLQRRRDRPVRLYEKRQRPIGWGAFPDEAIRFPTQIVALHRHQQPAVAQDAVAGYRLIKLVVAMPTSTVYAIDTIVAEMTTLSIVGSKGLRAKPFVVAHLNGQV